MAVYRDRPNPISDSTQDAAPGRRGRYGEGYTLPLSNNQMFAGDEGSYFMAITPTPGTGIIGHAAPTTFDETKPYLLLYNGSSNLRYYPQFLRLHDTVVSVGGARVQFTICVDNTNRYSSAGTALTINNVNMDSTNSSNASAYVGAVVATAASASRRILDHVVFRGTIDVVEDVYTIAFGAPDGMSPGTSRAATVEDAGRVVAPVCIGPGQSLLVHQWAGSQSTGPTFQVALGFIAR